MPAPRKYPAELRQRAVRLVMETRDEGSGETVRGAVVRIGRQLGINADTLRGWVRQAEIDQGRRPGLSTAERGQDLNLRPLGYESRESVHHGLAKRR